MSEAMKDFGHSDRIRHHPELNPPVQWLKCEPAMKISDRQYWQARVDQGLTTEELCYFVRKENQYSMAAWRLLVQRDASLDHFRHIAIKSLHYQPPALKYILVHSKDKNDLLFVFRHSEELRYSAARKCIALCALAPQELCNVLTPLGNEQQVDLLVQIRKRYRHNIASLDSCEADLPESCKLFLAQIRSETEERLRGYLTAEKRKSRIKAAQKLVRQFPSIQNFALVLSAIETEAISQWTQPIAATCLTKTGIDWKRASALLPENPPMDCNEFVEFLSALGNRRDALRILLVHSKGFRRFAAAGLLALQPVPTSDIILILTRAPYRYRKQATKALLGRKGVPLRVLVLAWRRTYDMRPDIERILLKRKSNVKTKEYLAQKAPDLLIRLNRHRGHP